MSDGSVQNLIKLTDSIKNHFQSFQHPVVVLAVSGAWMCTYIYIYTYHYFSVFCILTTGCRSTGNMLVNGPWLKSSNIKFLSVNFILDLESTQSTSKAGPELSTTSHNLQWMMKLIPCEVRNSICWDRLWDSAERSRSCLNGPSGQIIVSPV